VIPKQATGWTVQSSNLCTGKRSLLQNIQTGAGGPRSLLLNGYRVSFPGGKMVGEWCWQLISTYSRG